jgi:hypothetical protein
MCWLFTTRRFAFAVAPKRRNVRAGLAFATRFPSRKRLSSQSMTGPALFWRAPLTALAFASWLVATSHCSFAAAMDSDSSPSTVATASDECPMHAAAKRAPQPQKKNGCGDLPCCKNLFASIPTKATALTKPICFDAAPENFAARVGPFEGRRAQKLSPILGTGPPGTNNFTESVLQRSILAHAPPHALS